MTRMRLGTLVALAIGLAAPAAAQGAAVSYIDGGDAWVSSPDGALKQRLTTDGTTDRPWQAPVQAIDGRTLVVHRDTFEDGSSRPVLHLFGADGKRITANVMPVYSGATIPVYPIGMDVDWNGNAVAYGYSYCGFACNSIYRGFWLTFSDHQSLYPSDPQGQSDALLPTFFGTRVVSVDSGGSLFVQPDVPEAPFTSSYDGWLAAQDINGGAARLRWGRAVAASTGSQVALEYTVTDNASPYGTLEEGVLIGERAGNLPADVGRTCSLTGQGVVNQVSFSPDGKQIAWQDDGGVKVAGAPDLSAGTEACTLTSVPTTLSATGRSPDFGGATLAPQGSGSTPGGSTGSGSTGGGGGGGGGTPAGLKVTAPAKVSTAVFARGIKLRVTAPAAGRISATATVPARAARRLRARASLALAADVRGLVSAAKAVKVASGRSTAAAPGPVTLRLKPTAAAKRRAKRLKGVKLTIRVTQGSRSRTLAIRLR